MSRVHQSNCAEVLRTGQCDCTVQPFNPAAHDWLVSNGYHYKAYDEDYWEVGDAESGPKMDGHPAFDEYWSDTEYVYVGADGSADREARDIEWENWVDQQTNDPEYRGDR